MKTFIDEPLPLWGTGTLCLSKQCAADSNQSPLTMNPPQMYLLSKSIITWYGNSPGLASVPPIILGDKPESSKGVSLDFLRLSFD